MLTLQFAVLFQGPLSGGLEWKIVDMSVPTDSEPAQQDQNRSSASPVPHLQRTPVSQIHGHGLVQKR